MQLLFSSFVVFVFLWHVKRRHPHHLRCSSRCHFGGAALVRIPRFWRLKASRGEIHDISNISIAFCTISAICFLPELRTNKLGRLPQDLNLSNTLRISSNLDTIYESILIIGSLSQIFGNAGRLWDLTEFPRQKALHPNRWRSVCLDSTSLKIDWNKKANHFKIHQNSTFIKWIIQLFVEPEPKLLVLDGFSMSLTTVANLVFFVAYRVTRHWGRDKDTQTVTLVFFFTNFLMVLICPWLCSMQSEGMLKVLH